MTGRRFAAIAGLLAGVALLGSSCSVQLEAVQLEVRLDDTGFVLAKPASGSFRGGETVITIMNVTSQKRQFTLAQTSAKPTQIPTSILNAFSYQDDARVAAVSGVMRGARLQSQFGLVPQLQPTEEKLHVYMQPGKPYLLFDRLGGYKHGVVLRLQPRK
jgi:hypothetical protein